MKNQTGEGANLTEVEVLKTQLIALKKELQETKKSSQQYLQNVAHQLTAPLGAIKWNIEAIKDEKVPVHKKMKLLSSVYSQATILVHLIKNFALMSNLEADQELGQYSEKSDPVDVFRLAVNLASDFQPQAMEGEKKIDVDEESFLTAIAGKSLSIEKNLVAQAISNLLENAVKYADKGTTIKVSAARNTSTVSIQVTSIGMPIKQEERAKLFDRGFRGELARQQVPAGTGIGLYLARHVMRIHQGEISLETNNRTATFILSFPATRLV